MDNSSIASTLKMAFGDRVLEISEPYGLLTVTIEKDSITEITKLLMSDKSLQFTFLTDLTGIHYPESKGRELGVIYHLHSFIYNTRIRIKLFTDVRNPVVPSLTSQFNSANWMERETYDFYGIHFQGHPNLKRILNMDEMDYFPMQKQYPLEDMQREDKEDRFFGR
jgi:NADH-quinone oxidoreductase subunit C